MNESPINHWPGVPATVKNFLQLRGFESYTQALAFLQFSLKDLTDPSKLLGVDRAVERLARAYTQGESICVYGDFDMDGTPAVALLVRGLRALGFKKVSYLQADRHKDGYGFHAHLAQKRIAEDQTRLFITVDVGITDIEAVGVIQQAGVDVIITDHHQEKEQLPPAYVVINPNQKQDTSGLGYLCGSGVAFYLMIALNRHFRQSQILPQGIDVKPLLDCFAIATIADLVPLQKENRILVKHGLKVLEDTSMLGIRALMNLLQLHNKSLTPADVGIRLVPKLNSLTRMGGDVMPIELFLVEDVAEAKRLATQALEVNDLRVNSLRTAELELAEHIQKKTLARGSESQEPKFFWSYSATFHKGLVGLLAARVVNSENKSAFVGALMSDGKTIVGSARTPQPGGYNVFEALTYCSDFLNKFGGHPQAAGFELSVESADVFEAKLEEYFNTQAQRTESSALAYDLSVSIKEAKDFLGWLEKLEPFGVGFLPPQFCFLSVIVSEVKALKGGEHFKLLLRDDAGDTLSAIVFSHKGEAFIEQGSYSIIGQLQWNEFRGNRTPQFLVEQIFRAPEAHHTLGTENTL